MTDQLELAVRAKAAGIALTLEACISSAALRCVAAATGSGTESSDTSDGIHSVDLQRLLGSMQQMLVRALEELQRNLAEQALEILRDQVEARHGSP